jgi:Spy/CpxP family protein refolding chaperone
MKTTKQWMGAVALVALLVPAISLAQPGRGWGDGPRGAGEALWEKLELTEAQRDQLQDLRQEHRQTMVRLRGETAQARAELQALLLDPEVGKTEALQAQAKVSDLRAKAARLRLEHRFAVRSVLTPEQREKMEALRAERPGRGDGRGMGPRRGDGPGPHGPGACDGDGPHGPRRRG